MGESQIVRTRERLARLQEPIRQFSAACAIAGPPATYVFAGWSLVNRQVVEANPDLLSRVIRVDGETPSVRLPLSAREIYLRTDARVFGFDLAPHMTAKIVAPRAVQDSLSREKVARRALAGKLAGSPHVRIPSLYGYGTGGQWLIEEFVEGDRATMADLESFLAGGAAEDFYRASVRLRPLARLRAVTTMISDLAAIDPSFPTIPEDGLLPVGINHGDLQHHNLLRRQDGQFCLVDMGQARVAPIAVDLAWVYHQRKDLLNAILAFIRLLDPSGYAMEPELQLALGLAADWREKALVEGKPEWATKRTKKGLIAIQSAIIANGTRRNR